jgi:integrase
MGLTRRKDSFYVEFRVTDDGKTFALARGVPGATLKRWKVSSLNKTVAKQQEALIKTDLMKGIVKSDQVQGPITFKALAEAYLALPRVMAQANYERKQRWVELRFLPTFGANRLITAITPDSIEAYYQSRRKEVALATANRELAAIKHIFSWACGTAKKLKLARPYLDRDPARAVWKEEEDNVRDEILEPAQFEALQAHSAAYLVPINLVAYATGMRWGEIVHLTWDKVDLKGGFIRLKGKDTKSGEGRMIPLDVFPGLREMFKELHKTRALHEPHVFLHGGQPVLSLKGAFMAACKGAGITNFRFHDFRQTAITNMRRAGIDLLTIMEISGHKTMVCFTRYNSFREADLKAAALKSNTYLTLAHAKVSEQRSEGEGKLAASA